MNINKSKRKSIKAATSWVDAYEDLEEAAMKFFPDEEAMEHAVDTCYRVNRDDPGYQEAYKRWCESFTDEDREDAGLPTSKSKKQILYIIQDKHGNQLSSPNPDDSELWDRVASMEARGRRGLSVVVYNRNYVGSSSIVATRTNKSFTCPSCHNKTLYCTDHDVSKLADIDYHDTFVCDECGSCFEAEVQHDGDIRFKKCRVESSTMPFSDWQYRKNGVVDEEDYTDEQYNRDFEEYQMYLESLDDVEGSDEYPCRTNTCSFATWLDEEHGLTEEEWEELPQDEADAIYDDYRGTMRIIRQGKSSITSSEDFEDYEDEIQEIDQEFTSENTSINSGKLPAIFGLVHFEPGTINIDYGGGKFDNVAEYLTQYDVINLVYDPYNRSKEHNKEVLRTCRAAGGADTATCSNVLNVIKEPEVRKNVLENIKKIVKPTGTVYITVYEGSGKGNEGPTKSGYQLNRKTADYLQEIQEVFPDAVRKGKLIVAHPSRGSVTSAEDLSYDALTSEDYIYDLWTLIQDENGEWVREDKIDTYDTYEEGEAQALLIAEDGPCELVEIGPDGTSVVWTSQEDITSASKINSGRLVDPPDTVIDDLIKVLNTYGFVLDPQFDHNPSKTWMGDVHLQVINTESYATTVEEVRRYVSDAMIDAIHAVQDKHDCPITWNFGANKDGQVTGGLDIMKQYVPDDEGSDIYSSTNDGLQSQIYDYLDTLGGYADYNQKIEEVVDEFGVSPDVAETYVCNWIQDSGAEWSDEADIEDDEIFGAYRSTGAPREEDLPYRYWEPGSEDIDPDGDYTSGEMRNRMYRAAAMAGGDVDDLDIDVQGDTLTIRFLSLVDHEDPSFEDEVTRAIKSELSRSRFNSQITVSVNPPKLRGEESFVNYEIIVEAHAGSLDDELPFQASTNVSSTSVTSRKLDLVRKELTDKLYNAASKLLQTPEYGFPFDEIANMLFVDIKKDSIGLRVEVRAELSYDGMWGLKEKLDPIVQKYDEDSYFDMDDPGIMSAYITISSNSSTVESATKKPRWWDSMFRVRVIEAYKKGELSFNNIDEWETAYNGGVKPRTSLGTREILKYYLDHPESVEESEDIFSADYGGAYDIDPHSYNYPERPIDPPEYDEPSYETDECTIELDLDTVIIVDPDGSWEYEDEEYSFATNPDSKDGDWYSDKDEVHVIDPVGVVEQLDEFIEDRIPALPGRYRIKGKVTLVYDVEGIAVDYTYDSYDEGSYRDFVDKDNAEVIWNESKSSIDHIDITEE